MTTDQRRTTLDERRVHHVITFLSHFRYAFVRIVTQGNKFDDGRHQTHFVPSMIRVGVCHCILYNYVTSSIIKYKANCAVIVIANNELLQAVSQLTRNTTRNKATESKPCIFYLHQLPKET